MSVFLSNLNSIITKLRQLTWNISITSALFAIASIVAIPSAHAEYCNCNEGKIYTIDIAELNAAHPKQFNLELNNAYYQLVDNNGKVIQDKLYDVTPYEDGRIVAKRGGYYGVIDATGKVVIAFEYDEIELLANGFYQLAQYFGSQPATAIADNSGDWLYPASGAFEKNTQVDHFYRNKTKGVTYFKVLKDGKYGLINSRKQTLIRPTYDEMELLNTSAHERLFIKATLKHKVGLIDQYQKVIIPFSENTTIENFNEDKQLFSVKSYVPQGDGNIGHLNRETVTAESLINANGETLIKSESSIRLLNSELYEYKDADKYGIVDRNGVILLLAEFDHLYSQYSQYNAPILAARDQKIAIIVKDNQQRLVVDTFYDALELTYDTYTLSEIQNQTVHDTNDANSDEKVSDEGPDSATSTVRITKQANSELQANTYNPNNTHYIARKDYKFGIVDSQNKIVVPLIYDELSYFESFIKVKKGSKYGLLTNNNETIKPLIHDDIVPLSDSNGTRDNIGIVFTKDNQQQLTDKFGSILTPFSDYRFVENKLQYLDNMSVIEKQGKYGLFSVTDKKIIVQPIYEDFFERIYNDSILAQLDGKKVLIDISGNILVDDLSQYAEIKRSSKENNIVVKTYDDKYGVIDYQGETIIPAAYESLELQELSNSYDAIWGENKESILFYVAEKKGKYGIFDHSGKRVAPIAYSYIQSLTYPPYFLVGREHNAGSEDDDDTQNSNLGLMDSTGKLVVAMDYQRIINNPYDPEGKLYVIDTQKKVVKTYDKNATLIDTQNLQAFKKTNEWYKD